MTNEEVELELRRINMVLDTIEISMAVQAKALFDLQSQVVKLMGEMITALKPNPLNKNPR